MAVSVRTHRVKPVMARAMACRWVGEWVTLETIP
jgi:hypothetical protein